MTRANHVCVTGAAGLAGRVVVQELSAHGYAVTATDLAPTKRDLDADVVRADLTDYGQTVEVLRGVDAVVHLANIPAPGIATPVVTFQTNTAINFNVFDAATRLELKRVVWASSETTLGMPFGTRAAAALLEADGPPPRYVPVDEAHTPGTTVTYALSKVVSETIAAELSRWSGIPFVALRFSNIMDVADYQQFPEFWADPGERKWNLWGYVDVRDAATACRLALQTPDRSVTGSPAFIIAAADTVMSRPTRGLLDEVFPDVPIRRPLGTFDTLLAIDAARETLGYAPTHSWRDHITER
jgi:nucleoside-diphosphate-sugar epimerase